MDDHLKNIVILNRKFQFIYSQNDMCPWCIQLWFYNSIKVLYRHTSCTSFYLNQTTDHQVILWKIGAHILGHQMKEFTVHGGDCKM